MIKLKTIKGMKIELRTGNDASLTSEILIDGRTVGCDALSSNGCDKLFNELTRDKTGEKATYLKQFMEENDSHE